MTVLGGILRKERKKSVYLYLGARLQTKKPKAVVKLDTLSVEHVRMLKLRLIKHLGKISGGFTLAWAGGGRVLLKCH